MTPADLGRVLVTVENEYVEPVDRGKTVNGAIEGMVAGLDPHSSYMTPQDFALFQSDTQGEVGGVGVEVEARGGSASDRLLWLFEQVVDNDGRLETAVRAWAASDPAAQRVVRRADRRRLDYLERLLRDLGLPKPVAVARSRFAYYAVIGEFTMGATAPRSRRRAAARVNHAMIVSRA